MGNQSCSIQVEETPNAEDLQAVNEGLAAYNRRFAPGDGFQALTIFLHASRWQTGGWTARRDLLGLAARGHSVVG